MDRREGEIVNPRLELRFVVVGMDAADDFGQLLVIVPIFQSHCEGGWNGSDLENAIPGLVAVLLLDKVDAEDGVVPGQSSQYIHRSSDLSSLGVHRAEEPPYDLDIVPAEGYCSEPVVWRCLLQGPVARQRPVLFLRDTGNR